MKKFLLIGIIAALIFIGSVDANWCKVGNYHQTYYPQQYNYSQNNYQYTYPDYYVDPRWPGWYYYRGQWYYSQIPVEKVILVPKVIYVETKRDHYYSIDDYYKYSLFLDALENRLRKNGVDPKTYPKPVTPEVEKPEPLSKAGPFQKAELITSLNNHCLKCHGGTGPDKKPITKGGLSLLTADGKVPDFSNDYVWKIFGKVATREMPKDGVQVEEKEARLYYEWAKATEGVKP